MTNISGEQVEGVISRLRQWPGGPGDTLAVSVAATLMEEAADTLTALRATPPVETPSDEETAALLGWLRARDDDDTIEAATTIEALSRSLADVTRARDAMAEALRKVERGEFSPLFDAEEAREIARAALPANREQEQSA